MPLEPGLAGTAELVVADEDTAVALETGDVPVLATPRVARLAEQATVRAVHDRLADGTTTVGYRVQLDHLAPTAVGGRVQAEAMLENVEGRRLTFRVSVSDGHGLVAAGRITMLENVEGRRLTFRVSVSDGHGLVAAGRITRVVVERARFLEKAAGG